MKYLFNTDESIAADILGITVKTLQTWRNNGTLPDYLYRRFGASGHQRIRYCELLLLRWQSLSEKDELKTEEVWARGELVKSLAVRK